MTILGIQNLTKRFGGFIAVNNLSFSVEEGELIGLIGPNGSGKTTVFNLVSGFLRPDKGNIIFKGINITKFPPHSRAKLGIGRTFQIPQPLLKFSTLRNVVSAALLNNEKVDKAEEISLKILYEVGLYDKRLWEASKLNTSERKRLELARVLALDPDILLLDEICAGLNPAELEGLLKFITEVNKKGKTIIMVEHVMRAIMAISQRVIVLHHGEKIAEGTPSEVTNDSKVIEVYLGAKV